MTLIHPGDIEVGVSTMNETSAQDLCGRLGLTDQGVRVLIINQCPDGMPPADMPEGRVRMYSFRERGVSRSRNRVLDLCQGKIVVFADNDIEYLPGFTTALAQAFSAHPQAAVMTFPVLSAETGLPTRRFPKTPRRHTPLSITGVGTIEIAVRPRVLGAIRFDERFGLGAPVPQGDEPVFLTDALRAGRQLRYWPVPLCQHPGLSSGQQPWSKDMVRIKSTVLRRMYPRAWPVFSCAMWAAKYSRYGRVLGLRQWTQAWLDAARTG